MNILLFDTETTGLPQPSCVPLDRQPRIIEIGAVLYDTDRHAILDEMSQLIHPGIRIPEEITKITGITDEDIKGAPSFKEVIPAFAKLARRSGALLAHNVEFDRTMLRLDLERIAMDDFPWPDLFICTVQEFQQIMGFRPRLTDAYEHFTGEKLKQTHRALDDVKALLTCCEKSGLLELL